MSEIKRKSGCVCVYICMYVCVRVRKINMNSCVLIYLFRVIRNHCVSRPLPRC